MTDSIPDGFLERMAARFRVLGDATRLSIVRCLLRGGEHNVSEVVAETGCSQANASKHLKQLHLGGLVVRRKQGLQVFYRINDPLVERLCKLVSESVKADLQKAKAER